MSDRASAGLPSHCSGACGRPHDIVAGRNAFIRARFRQAEIQNLNAGLGNHYVARLEIAMNDALGVRLGQRLGDPRRVKKRRLQGERSTLQPGR